MTVDAPAADEFEHEVGASDCRLAAVEQAGDRRMLEARQDLAFEAETLGDVAAAVTTESRIDHLDRHLLLVGAVVPDGAVDAAPAAVADFLEQPIGADAAGRAHPLDRRDLCRRGLEEGGGAGVGLEQRRHLVAQVRPAGACFGDERGALGRRLLERRLHQ